ncbi:autotransporter outer membrane beta-barrel domain-containing protein [Escherichia coli]|nr:autotransporter outer membrane beta-barrel domain-containing protein [Escherichia coli]
MKKEKIICLGIASCITGIVNASDTSLKPPVMNENIISGHTYNSEHLFLGDSSRKENLTLKGNSILTINGGSYVTNTRAEDTAYIQLKHKKDIAPDQDSRHATPEIGDTVIDGKARLDMGAVSSSSGNLFIGKEAVLRIDNTDSDYTDVTVNHPALPGNVWIDNLTLAGTAEIGPAWTGNGNDGDAPLPESVGPELRTVINNLQMQPGSKLVMKAYASGAQFNNLYLQRLSGEGDFYLSSSLADGAADRIYVSEYATGNFGLHIKDSGREIRDPRNVQLVYIHAGDANFRLLNRNGIVEAGVWQYKLSNKTENGHTEWYLAGGAGASAGNSDTAGEPGVPQPSDAAATLSHSDSQSSDAATSSSPGSRVPGAILYSPVSQAVLSNSARAVINMASAPAHILDVENSTLRQRMGDLRQNDGDTGAWIRYLRDDSRLSDNRYSAYRSTLNGVQIGVDHRTVLTEGGVLVGAFTSFSRSHIKSENQNDGSISSYGGGLYATWIDNSGYYVDTLLKVNHLSNEVRTNMNSGRPVRGDYSQNAFTVSTEAGYSVKAAEMLWLTPYGKVAYSRSGKADYSLDNGMKARVHAADSVLGEAGVLLETSFSMGGSNIRPYVKTAVSREFVSGNEAEINDILFRNYYSGNTGKFGVGVTADAGKNVSVYAEAGYQKGKRIETPFRASAGLRISF